MISRELAEALAAGGLRWEPVSGDRFLVPDRDLDEEVFVVSGMAIEVSDLPTGAEMRFNGTVEWALDSLDQDDALWLPAEHQLRDLLGAAFLRLERSADGYDVVLLDTSGSASGESTVSGPNPAEAYGRAVLARLQSVATAS